MHAKVGQTRVLIHVFVINSEPEEGPPVSPPPAGGEGLAYVRGLMLRYVGNFF